MKKKIYLFKKYKILVILSLRLNIPTSQLYRIVGKKVKSTRLTYYFRRDSVCIWWKLQDTDELLHHNDNMANVEHPDCTHTTQNLILIEYKPRQ